MNKQMKLQPLVLSKGTEVGFVNQLPGQPLPVLLPTKIGGFVVVAVIMGLLLFGGLGSWAALAPMRSAVIAIGTFKVKGDRQVVQHLEGGIIREIFVKEGMVVKQGDPIARLDGTRTSAQLGILQIQLASVLAQGARLNVEYTGQEVLELTPELSRLISTNPALGQFFKTQREVFQSNLRLEQGQIAILRERINQLQEQMVGAQARRSALVKQLELTREEINDLKDLVAKGLVVKARFTIRRLEETALIGDLGVVESEIQGVHQQKAEIQERILQVRRNRLLKNAAERQQLQEREMDIRQRINAVSDVASRLLIKSPQDGRIVGLEINTLGEVIASGQKIMELVPTDSGIVVESRIRPSDIDEVSEGMAARVRLSAYSFRTTPPVEGRVSYVSADSFLDENTGQSYFLADIEIDSSSLADVQNIQTLPGMPAQVMIATGEQTIVDYLLNPILGGIEKGMSEGS